MNTITSTINTISNTVSKMTLPKTYKAAVIPKGGGDFQIRDIELKEPTDGEVLVKVLACGVCRSDDLVKNAAMPLPDRIPGHEIVGKVVAVPSSEKVWKVGQRVGGGWHGGHDGKCNSCKAGDFMTCDNEAINGITQDGGYAEYAILRTEAVVALPETIEPAELAPQLCAGVTVFNSLRNMNIIAGSVVAVQGLGGLGHLAVQYAAKMGYNVVAISGSASKEKLAKELGAHHYIDGSKEKPSEALQKLGGASCLILTGGGDAAELIKGLAVNGTLLTLAVGVDINFNTLDIIQKRISVRGWPAGTAKDSEETIAFAEHANIKCMVQTFPLSKVTEAYAAMDKNTARFRSVLVME